MSTSTLEATSQPVTESADRGTSFTVTSTSTDTSITAVVTSSVVLGIGSSSSTITTTPTSTNTTLIINSPTLSSSSQSDGNNSFGVVVAVAIVVLVVVVLIIITVVVIGIIVVWKKKKSIQHIKPEDVYYSTIDEITLPKSPTKKPAAESDYIEMNDKQDNKEPQYINIPDNSHSTKQGNKVAMKDNPAYFIPSDEIQDNSVISTSPVMVTFTVFKE